MSKCLLTGGIKGEVITKVTASHDACGFSSVLPSRLQRGETPPEGLPSPSEPRSPLSGTPWPQVDVSSLAVLLMHGQRFLV